MEGDDTMIGTTGLKHLQVACIVGVDEHERAQPQPVVIDIELDYDFAAAAGSDAVGDAVDYDRVAAEVTGLVQRREFTLIETMAEETAAMLLERMAEVRTIRLEIRKPQAVAAAACSFVRVERTRG